MTNIRYGLFAVNPSHMIVNCFYPSVHTSGSRWGWALPLSPSKLFYCGGRDNFSLTVCTFKHRRCTYLSHSDQDHFRLSPNLHIHFAQIRPSFVRFVSIEYFKHYYVPGNSGGVGLVVGILAAALVFLLIFALLLFLLCRRR